MVLQEDGTYLPGGGKIGSYVRDDGKFLHYNVASTKTVERSVN